MTENSRISEDTVTGGKEKIVMIYQSSAQRYPDRHTVMLEPQVPQTSKNKKK